MNEEVIKEIGKIASQRLGMFSPTAPVSPLDDEIECLYRVALLSTGSDSLPVLMYFYQVLPALFTEEGAELLLKNCLNPWGFWSVLKKATLYMDGDPLRAIRRAISEIRVYHRRMPFNWKEADTRLTEIWWLGSIGAVLMEPIGDSPNEWKMRFNPLFFEWDEIERFEKQQERNNV